MMHPLQFVEFYLYLIQYLPFLLTNVQFLPRYTGLVDIDSEFSWNARNFVENEALSSNVKRIF